MTATATDILSAHYHASIERPEAVERLEELEVRGEWRTDGSFIGYDYRNQEWIDTREAEGPLGMMASDALTGS